MSESKPPKLLDFEKPIFDMQVKIEELEDLSRETGMNLNGGVRPLKDKLDQLIDETFSNLTPWQRVALARHPGRPYTSDYVDWLMEDFVELHGDRAFSDDPALLCGLGKLGPHQVLLVGHRKGRDLKEKIACNFGCAHPEGYKKALRKMKVAEKFGIPIVALIDTPGAYPGIGAEERGQAFAIAENLMFMAGLRVPVVCVVIGEGGSGGALGIGIGDRILMLEHSYYSVISPEGCAAILWKTSEKAQQAAEALRLTSWDLLELGIVDDVIREPRGGAHRLPEEMGERLSERLIAELDGLAGVPIDDLLDARYEKFRQMGALFADSLPDDEAPDEAATSVPSSAEQ